MEKATQELNRPSICFKCQEPIDAEYYTFEGNNYCADDFTIELERRAPKSDTTKRRMSVNPESDPDRVDRVCLPMICSILLEIMCRNFAHFGLKFNEKVIQNIVGTTWEDMF